MTDLERTIAERKNMSTRELFLAAKREIDFKRNAGGAKIWFISYPRYDIKTEKLIGHTPALKSTKKEVETFLNEDYCGMTLATFLAEQSAWIDEQTTKASQQLSINYQGYFVSDKVKREVKACDDSDDVFNLLPTLDAIDECDELIDAPCRSYSGYIGDDDDFETKLAELHRQSFAAKAALDKAQADFDRAQENLQNFINAQAYNLKKELDALAAELNGQITLRKQSGYAFTVSDFSEIYIDALQGGKEFAFTDWRGRAYARYDTPAQVSAVIRELRAAIERSDKEFSFPSVEELIQDKAVA